MYDFVKADNNFCATLTRYCHRADFVCIRQPFVQNSIQRLYRAGRPIIRKVSKIRIWVVPQSAWAVLQ